MARNTKTGIKISQYKDKNEYQRQWRKLNPNYEKIRRNHEKVREAAWRRRYGIERSDYERLLELQGGCCAICKSTSVGRNHQYFHVDHDHASGVVRGLLCDKCNRGLGYFSDNPVILENASDYLKSFPNMHTSKRPQSLVDIYG